MKRLFMIIVLAAAAAGLAEVSRSEMASDAVDPVEPNSEMVVHLSHFTDDLHRCAMALKIANLMQAHGSQVTLFLDLEGVRLAERRQKLDLAWGADARTLAELYDKFTEAGGRVLLCPHCAGSARIGDMALRRHARIAAEEDLAEMFAAAEKVIDY